MSRLERQQGVALVLLLVMLASLTLLVTGVTGHARLDTRLTQALVQRAQAGSLMEGYAHVVLRDMTRALSREPAGPGGSFRKVYVVGDRRIEATVYPAAAFADPSAATPEFAAQLFQHVGGVSGGQARGLAERLVEYLSADVQGQARTAGQRRLIVIEDLLQVPGMRRDVYEKMAPVIRIGGAARPSPDVARRELLPALKGGEGDVVAAGPSAGNRNTGGGRGRPAGGLGGGLNGAYEIMLSTTFVDGARYLRRISVQGARGGAVPYSIRRVHPVAAQAPG